MYSRLHHSQQSRNTETIIHVVYFIFIFELTNFDSATMQNILL